MRRNIGRWRRIWRSPSVSSLLVARACDNNPVYVFLVTPVLPARVGTRCTDRNHECRLCGFSECRDVLCGIAWRTLLAYREAPGVGTNTWIGSDSVARDIWNVALRQSTVGRLDASLKATSIP
jgi:hypothetical protein